MSISNGERGVAEHAPPAVLLRQLCAAMIGLRRGSPPSWPLVLFLALLARHGSAYGPVVGLRCAVGWHVRGPSKVANTNSPWELAPPFRKREGGGHQCSGDSSSTRMRIHRLPKESRATACGSCFSACRSCVNSSGRSSGSRRSSGGGGGGVSAGTTGGFFAHNTDSGDGKGIRDSNNVGFSSEVVCDQCGDSYRCNDTLESPPPPTPVDASKQPQQPQARQPLAVCKAPGCGVAFSQCQSCEVEYAGCCSVACQTLAAQNGPPSAAAGVEAVAGDPAKIDPRAVQVALSINVNAGAEKKAPVVEGDSGHGDSLGKDVLRQDGDASTGGKSVQVTSSKTVASTPLSEPSPSEPSPSSPSGGPQQVSDKSDGSQRVELESARPSSLSGGVSTAGRVAAAAGGGGKAKRKREKPADEPLLENYASRHSNPESASLADIRGSTNRAQPGGAHMVSGHLQGELLKLLTKLSGAKRVLDIGTFTGYSALAFAEALPEDGVVVTLESDARAAETARGHFAASEHGGKIRLLLGQAMDAIDQMIGQEDSAPFDIIFVDADKKKYWDYFDKVLSGPRPVLAPAGMLLADNVLFHELVPLAEATAAPAAAATPQEDTPPTGTADKLQVSDGGTSREIPPARAEEEKAKVAATTAAAAVGAGVLAPTPRRMKIAESLDAFNKRVREDPRVEVLMLPLRDGLSVVRWRSGAYPDGGES